MNNHLLADLTELGLWDPSLKNDLIANNGSVQADIPDNLKAIYKTVWEIKQVLVDMAADGDAFIDQSQSFNVHMSDANSGSSLAALLRVEEGPKTGMYYLRPAPPRRGQVHRGPGQGGAGRRRRRRRSSPRQGECGGERRGEESPPPGYGGGGDMAAKLACSLANKDDCACAARKKQATTDMCAANADANVSLRRRAPRATATSATGQIRCETKPHAARGNHLHQRGDRHHWTKREEVMF